MNNDLFLKELNALKESLLVVLDDYGRTHPDVLSAVTKLMEDHTASLLENAAMKRQFIAIGEELGEDYRVCQNVLAAVKQLRLRYEHSQRLLKQYMEAHGGEPAVSPYSNQAPEPVPHTEVFCDEEIWMQAFVAATRGRRNALDNASDAGRWADECLKQYRAKFGKGVGLAPGEPFRAKVEFERLEGGRTIEEINAANEPFSKGTPKA